jgi:hypothetical protein
LREAARVLDIPIRNVLELFWDLGVSGNLDASDAINALNFAQEKLSAK